jgi:hypothetical protein
MEENYQWRVRFNLSTSVKGVKTPEFTIEGVDKSDEEIREKILSWTNWTSATFPVQFTEK